MHGYLYCHVNIIHSTFKDKVPIRSIEDHAQPPEFVQLLPVSTDMLLMLQLFLSCRKAQRLQPTSTLGTIADPVNLDGDSDEPLEDELEESTTFGT